MSIALDAAAKAHSKQLSAAAKSEEVIVRGLEKLSGLLSKSPDVPAGVSTPIKKVASPAAKVVGSQVTFANKAQDAMVTVLEARAESGPSAEVPAPLLKVTTPFTKLIGSPHEVAAYSAKTARDWVAVRNSFQQAVRDAVVTPKHADA